MRYAETGYVLEIDLTTGNIERVETDPREVPLHLGGQGTAAKLLWHRVGPEVEPFSDENHIIFSVSPRNHLINGSFSSKISNNGVYYLAFSKKYLTAFSG